jgi:hypothetical protein
MLIALGAPFRGDLAFAPEDVLALDGFRSRIDNFRNDPTADEIVAIGQDKPAHCRNAVVVVDHERRAGLQRDFANLVDPKFGRISWRN